MAMEHHLGLGKVRTSGVFLTCIKIYFFPVLRYFFLPDHHMLDAIRRSHRLAHRFRRENFEYLFHSHPSHFRKGGLFGF